MRFGEIIASFLIHAALLGTAAWFYSPPPAPQESVPIVFELVEESLATESGLDSGLGSRVSGLEIVGTDPEIVPEMSGTDPEIEGLGARDSGLEVAGTDPEIEGLGSRNSGLEVVGTDPEIVGTDPGDEKEELRESGEIANKSDDIERARVVSDPVALNRITPVYPRSARRKGHEGCVTVELSVSESGEVSSAEIVSSSGHEELDASALGAVRTARFAPATEDGESVCGRVRLTFDFRLR